MPCRSFHSYFAEPFLSTMIARGWMTINRPSIRHGIHKDLEMADIELQGHCSSRFNSTFARDPLGTISSLDCQPFAMNGS
jgi:hypothetical protein